MAVATGVCDVVVAYRAFNERSGNRFGQVSAAAVATQATSSGTDNAAYPGLGGSPPRRRSSPAVAQSSKHVRRRHQRGLRPGSPSSTACIAANNPKAFFYGKADHVEEHQASRYIAEPLHLLDCRQRPTVVSRSSSVSAERARIFRTRRPSSRARHRAAVTTNTS